MRRKIKLTLHKAVVLILFTSYHRWMISISMRSTCTCRHMYLPCIRRRNGCRLCSLHTCRDTLQLGPLSMLKSGSNSLACDFLVCICSRPRTCNRHRDRSTLVYQTLLTPFSDSANAKSILRKCKKLIKYSTYRK